jgi:hypothetical protein
MELGLVHWSKINKGKIKIIVRVLQIDIGCKHAVFMRFEGIAESFENVEYVKPPN